MYSIEELRTIFTTYLNSKSFQEVPKKLYEPNNYFLQIGGKRLRPVLLLLATDLFGGDIKKSFPAALSIEYFHNFTLIHDDVMDDAPLRRGFQTIHTKYNLNTAILSGDVLLVKAYQCLSEIEEVYFKKIFDIYTKTAIEVCEGQQLDIDFETDENVTQEDYISMIRLKTSVLVAASMKIGEAMYAPDGKDEPQADHAEHKDSEDSRNAFNYQINKTIGINKRVLASIRIINLKNSGVYYVIKLEIQTKNPDSVEKLEIKSASKDNAIEQIKNIFIE